MVPQMGRREPKTSQGISQVGQSKEMEQSLWAGQEPEAQMIDTVVGFLLGDK